MVHLFVYLDSRDIVGSSGFPCLQWYGFCFGRSLVAALGIGFVWLNEKLETIYVRDWIYGRRFKCRYTVELAQKKAMLDDACLAFRRIVETANHWKGVERKPVKVPLPDDAKAVLARLC